MLFNSFSFLLFLTIFFGLYWSNSFKKLNVQNILVLISSYFFYAWWSWKFLCLLIFITALDYFFGFWVASENKKKARVFLWLSILNNLGVLFIFKYYNFFVYQLRDCLNTIDIIINPFYLQLALPIGISFYTFHGMSYIFDVYHGKINPEKNFVRYAVFVSFFPLLVAGPIERANHFLPQIRLPRIFNYTQAVEGCRLILWGMFKKVMVADSLAKTVDYTFSNYSELDSISLIFGATLFSFQIYADFSGYSDIAIGTAKLFGFELLSNFKFPYFSRDLSEFWRRWHISLSTWFRDYLYIPIGGSKNGKNKAVRNTFVIFLISGFWHGSSWNFLIWGFIHACGFIPLLVQNKNRQNLNKVVAEDKQFPSLFEIYQILKTFIFVTIAWVFFRAETVETAFNFLYRIYSGFKFNLIFNQPLNIPIGKTELFYTCILILGDWNFRRDERKLNAFFKEASIRYLIYSVLITIILLKLAAGNNSNFIYFQF